MLTDWTRKVVKAVLIGTLFLPLQACTSNLGGQQVDVADAYSSSGAIYVTPYNRTIFSSHNF